jgi:hypothetical protein
MENEISCINVNPLNDATRSSLVDFNRSVSLSLSLIYISLLLRLFLLRRVLIVGQVAVGLWTDISVRLLTLPDLKEVVKELLGGGATFSPSFSPYSSPSRSLFLAADRSLTALLQRSFRVRYCSLPSRACTTFCARWVTATSSTGSLIRYCDLVLDLHFSSYKRGPILSGAEHGGSVESKESVARHEADRPHALPNQELGSRVRGLGPPHRHLFIQQTPSLLHRQPQGYPLLPICFSASAPLSSLTGTSHRLHVQEVNQVCPFNTASYQDCLAIAGDSSLTIGSIDEIQKLHMRSIPLGEMPRRIAHQVLYPGRVLSCDVLLCVIMFCVCMCVIWSVHFASYYAHLPANMLFFFFCVNDSVLSRCLPCPS